MAISGLITRSPLMMREVGSERGPLYSPFDIQAGALVQAITGKPGCQVVTRPEQLVDLSVGEHFDYAIDDLGSPSMPAYWRRESPGVRLFDYSDNLEETG